MRFRVTVEGADGQRFTRSYCAKAHLDGSPGNTLVSEARFYREIAPLLEVRTPRAYYSAVDESAAQAMIIMDDVVDMGGRFLSAHSPYSLETTRGSLAQLACLHASTWGGRTVGRPRMAVAPYPRNGRILSRRASPVAPRRRARTEIAPELRMPTNLLEAVRRTATTRSLRDPRRYALGQRLPR